MRKALYFYSDKTREAGVQDVIVQLNERLSEYDGCELVDYRVNTIPNGKDGYDICLFAILEDPNNII